MIGYTWIKDKKGTKFKDRSEWISTIYKTKKQAKKEYDFIMALFGGTIQKVKIEVIK